MARLVFKPYRLNGVGDTSSVQNGEMFVNTQNGVFYYKHTDGAVKSVLDVVRQVPASPDGSVGAVLRSTGGNGYAWQPLDHLEVSTYAYQNVFTRGYHLGGYAFSTPWTTVSKLDYGTETMSTVGDVLSAAGGYTQASFSGNKSFLYGTSSASYDATTAVVSVVNHTTETAEADLTLPRALNWPAVLVHREGDAAYLATVGGQTLKHTFADGTIAVAQASNVNVNNPFGDPSAAGANFYWPYTFGQNSGLISSQDYGCAKFDFATNVWSTHGQPAYGSTYALSFSTLFSYSYMGYNNYGTLARVNNANGVWLNSMSTAVYAGELGHCMFSNYAGYAAGGYNTVAPSYNTHTQKLHYANDVMVVLPAASWLKAHGASSGGHTSFSL